MLKYDITPGIKGLIFDLDGTLADTMPYHYEAWRLSAEEHNMIFSKEFMRSVMGGEIKAIAAKLCRNHGIEEDMPIESLLETKSRYYNKLMPNVTVIDEVMDIAKAYHKKLPMAIGTGGGRATISKTLEYTGIIKYFDIIVAADDVQNHKPAPDTFLKCAELIGVDPKDCEVFEDGDPGLEAARAGGMVATDIRPWIKPTW